MIYKETIATMMTHALSGWELQRRTYEAHQAHGANGAYGTHGANGTHGTNGTSSHFSLFILSLFIFFALPASAQIKVGGNVYGGGNQGDVNGSTRVNVYSGDIGAVESRTDEMTPIENPKGKLFGGARMANVGGNTFVNIDGENASGYVLINQVYGGNDIAGTIGENKSAEKVVPSELTAIKSDPADTDPKKNAVDNTFNSYVRISTKMPATPEYYTDEEVTAAADYPENPAWNKTPDKDLKPDPTGEKIYIGQLFGGGNGDYFYNNNGGTHEIYRSEADFEASQLPIATSTTDFILPELKKTYLEVLGGSIVYGYGGGNNATVKEQTIIHVDNPSLVTNHIFINKSSWLENKTATAASETITDLLCNARFKEMGINTGYSKPGSGEYQIGRFFGGNNKAEMDIRPTWNLVSGKIRNLYSGGNRGNMTSPEGLLLEIPDYSTLIADYVYGGCRMADVKPTVNEEYVPCTNLQDKDAEGNLKYKFPNELSARVLIRGGNINTVYGGNDVTGRVYGGNAVGIHTSIRGDVYGGGNGAYPYTDNPNYIGDDVYGDLYYEGILNDFRPNAEQVSIHLKGTEEKPTVIGGSIFCGGNCATLKSAKEDPLMELKIGSYVLADKAFLGNNGEEMIDPTILKRYATDNYNSMSLLDPGTFAEYMDGAAMSLRPSVVFDQEPNDHENYKDYTSQIGSFYCGGNVGSMIIPGKHTLRFDRGLIIFEKLVGGCNNANVEAGDYNAAYKGGILGSAEEQDSYMEGGKIKDRLEINLNNVVIQPKRWVDTFEPLTSSDLTADGKLKEGETYYTTDLRASEFVADGTEEVDVDDEDKYYKRTAIGSHLEWNTVKWDVGEDDFIRTGTTGTAADDLKRRLYGGNVYGGCFNSGHVNGNVIININQDLHQRDVLFAEADPSDPYKIKSGGDRRTGVLRESQGDDVQSVAMSVFGAGYGADTEIWGSTTVNLNNGYAFQIFGGGEEGVVGKTGDEGSKTYNALYTSTVNLKGAYAGYSEEEEGLPLAETEYIYGGGCEGDVLGDCYVYLGNGRVYDAFGGASNADIYGATEVHIGHNGGFPWIRDNIYGGNDFGGTIKGTRNHTTATAPREAFDAKMLLSSTYVKYIQGRVDSIFGGNYGNYDYKDPVFKDYTYSRGEEGKVAGDPRLDDKGNPVFHFPHLDDNSFVHFIPVDNSNNHASFIFGGSEGYPGENKLNNSMQQEAYVLIDDTKTKDANRFANVDIYGGGAFAGMGTEETHGAGRTAIDLYAGSFHNIYGGSNQEGLIGYTRVNVPATSTAKVNAIFGGGKGYDPALYATKPELQARYCDNYVTCVDYLAPNAIVEDAIYGGNHNSRIACDTYINIEAPVMQSSGYQATIYGAGYGDETVSGRTNVFMNNHSNAYKVFGGGRDGNAMNYLSLTRWLGQQFLAGGTPAGEVAEKVTAYGDILRTFGTYLVSNPIHLPTAIGTYPNANGEYDGTYTNDILTTPENPPYYNTNVHIMNGGNVSGYAYGGGFGENAVVSGDTYLELLGGNVDKDIYGGGQGGPVYDEYDLKSFTATTNVYIEGGMARNVYGGGYLGHVGKHTGNIQESNEDDIPAVTNVTIGKVDGTNFYKGIPAIQRNAYGGGEGGSVYGTANLTINNGYIGYRYKNIAPAGQTPDYQYVEELDDKTANAIEQAGNAFGGGYVVNSYVDVANLKMYGGTVRGSLYGGGEVGPIGRGTIRYKDTYTTTGIVNGNARIYKAGKTHVQLFDGHVKRNVFGGGRGHDSWGGDGTMYMDDDLKPLLDLQCKGYVFGQTEVDVYGGEVGTDEGVALGYGNVFGGGDIGCVYSAYELANGTQCIGKKNGTRYDGADNSEGYYYKYESGAFKTDGTEYILTEDCKVVVEPWCKATGSVSIDNAYALNSIVPEAEIAYINENDLSVKSSIDATGKVTAVGGIRYTHNYEKNDFVPTAALNTLGNKTASATEWTALGKDDVNKEGVIVHNAVFAGGNTSPGSTEVYANTTTVFGNATASIHDVYNRDLISIGRGRIGGLYGDGNLTLVGGYRELNITNYGTDYYHITPEITLTQYNALPYREQAYYEIRYKCQKQCTDNAKKTYAVGSTITADEMLAVFDGVTVGEPAQPMIQSNGKPLEEYWKENGVCSRYAGRPMNTVQRADFCGVFGSRMVMQGAQDRVPEVVDYTNYTINRVREVSLNKKVSVRTGDSSDAKNQEHGNYFGIYSVVNFLGALTSDVDFHTAVRVTDNTDVTNYQCDAKGKAYGTATYHDWKDQFHNERKRNNGNSHNKVALASGVYLELTTEKSTGTDLYEKDWGLITGVVELDLINVQPGLGGGYVYAKNAHGIRSNTNKDQVILTALNAGAVTNKHFQYDETENTKKEWETSGNFVHSTQTIIDDCYNIGGKYNSGYNKPNGVPAHYWFIKGAVYIYDQYISAYTGSPNAYSEIVNIPLTITSASHGKMTLLDVHPNLYAYYSINSEGTKKVLDESSKIELRETEYGLNDAINYWDWKTLSSHERKLFVDDTYVVTADCKIGNDTIYAGTVLLPGTSTTEGTYEYLKAHNDSVYHINKGKNVAFDFVFRSSNNVSHDTGYILTYNIDNPNQWNTWYTPKEGTSLTGKKDSEEIKSPSITPSDYEDGPTYTPNATGMYGQNDYAIGSIISNKEYTTYGTAYAKLTPTEQAALGTQATFHEAYIVTADVLETTNKSGTAQRFHKGATLSKEDYAAATWTAMSGSVALANVVTSTVQLSPTEFIYRNTYLTADEITSIKSKVSSDIATEIDKVVEKAYYCTKAGKYGGDYFQAGHNYRGLAAFSSLSDTDREKFTFNYDALDLLIDPTYSNAEGVKYQYDSAAGTLAGADANRAHYSLQSPIDYSATYKGDSELAYIDDNNTEKTATKGTELTRTEYERLPNEQYYYAPITVSNTSDTYYVVTETIVLGDTPYAAGQVIPKDTYDGLGDTEKEKVAKLTFTSTGDYYYCREGYSINASSYAVDDENKGAVTDINTSTKYTTTVPAGIVISSTDYSNIINKQKNFAIHGLAPTETSTLYVTRNSDIFDLSAEKIITVIYKYDYVESDMSGQHITPVSEYHVLNIHLNFKSGVPTVEDIKAPDIILPGTTISMPEPYVTPGAYEITGGGWKLFDTESDAESHINGVEYTPVSDPLYLYQNKHFLAYYAKSYLGETYSNYVPVSVANYHDLKKVMDAKEHHYYIDHKEIFNRLKVEPKIYINNYSGAKDGLDLFKDLYDLSLVTGSGDGYTVAGGKITAAESPANTSLVGHNLLNTNTRAERNLEFFLRTDIEHSGSWTSIGDDQYCDDPSTEDVDEGVAGKCFDGVFHGDGHTISGLDHSLFNYLCGEVYNLGVMGSFNEAGIAKTGGGYVESCWVKTTNETALGSKPYPIFGNPSRGSGYQLVNSYYSDKNKDLFNTGTNDRGTAIQVPDEAFYNGEVAYDLNNFYLYKRYSDHTAGASEAYNYYTVGSDKLELKTGKYCTNNAKECSTGTNGLKYVEDRFADGDFRYAAGSIPEEADERTYTDPEDPTKEYFYPIYPDDYIFFGQRLNYGYSATYPHNDTPTAIARFEGRLSKNPDANRVYRAPAYYRNSTMDVAHFNPHAYLAAKSKDGLKDAHPNMTAIDFAGHYEPHPDYGTYGLGNEKGKFYTPLLDDDGLQSIVNIDETQNLLVYAPASSGDGYVNSATHGVLTSYFADPAYADYYDNDDGYRLVADASAVTSSIYGHLVQSDLTATNDHLLVDKQDFDAPIAYDFDGSHRMWYQRIPEDQEYVDFTKGWQGISLPFTAELVTTHQKGEITHFYSGSDTSKNGTDTKVGHEYWLREFNNISTGGDPSVAFATFQYPTSAGGDETKDVTNKFLWDYYYKNEDVHDQQDANADTYLKYQQYYNTTRTYSQYPLLSAAMPYIIGFPGETYYEFDLSGNFEALNNAAPLDKLDKQTITFASATAAHINVSDTEKAGGSTAKYSGNDYIFKPNYMNQTLEADKNYVLNSDGNAFVQLSDVTECYMTTGSTYTFADETAFNTEKAKGALYTDEDGTTALTWGVYNTNAESRAATYYKRTSETPITKNEKNQTTTMLSAFRPYFFTQASSGSVKGKLPSRIIFGGANGDEFKEGPESALDGTVEIFARGRNIVTRSHMKVATTIRIVNIGGVTVANFVLPAGQTIETPVQAHGAYIVNKKKVFVR